MALPIFYGYSPTFLKYALHHLSLGGHLLVPCKSKLHHLSSGLCHFIALKFEQHHLPSEWCRFTSCLWNLNNVNFLQNDDRLYIRNRCCIISLLWACLCNVKILGGMFWHLQSLRSILWRLQSIGVIFPASLTSCWHFWNLDVWLQCNAPLMSKLCCL